MDGRATKGSEAMDDGMNMAQQQSERMGGRRGQHIQAMGHFIMADLGDFKTARFGYHNRVFASFRL